MGEAIGVPCALGGIPRPARHGQAGRTLVRDADRIGMVHGDVLDTVGREALCAGFGWRTG